MNRYVIALLRISMVLTPIAFLGSWHFDERVARYMNGSSSCGTALDTQDRAYISKRIVESSRSASMWNNVFNASLGALVGSSLFSLAYHRRWLARATGLTGGIATLRHRRRRLRLLSVRHPHQYANGFLLVTILLAVFAFAIGIPAFNMPRRDGLIFMPQLLRTITLALLVGSVYTSMTATRLAGRTNGSFGDMTRLVIAVGFSSVSLISCPIVALMMLSFG